jgi:uncharacterized protein (TIGR03437 family)
MRLVTFTLTTFMLMSGSLLGQFVPQVTSVANSASYAISGQNSFGIAQGSIFVVFGYGIGPNQLQQATTYPLPTTLGGTSVKITVGKVSWNAIMVYTSGFQIAAILPSAAAVGDGTLTVTYGGRTSPAAPVKVVGSGFGIYSVTSNGVGAGVITTPDYRLKTFTDSAVPSDTMVIWGTGLGPVNGNEAGGPLPGNVFQNLQVMVGNTPAKILYAGRSGCCAGLDQIVFQIPATPPGCFVPVSVRSGSITSNFVTVPVAALESSTCPAPVGVPTSLLTKLAAGQPVNVAAIAMGPVPILQGAGFSFTRSLAGRLSEMLNAPVSAQQIEQLVHARGPKRIQFIKALVRQYGPILKARHIDPLAVANQVNSLSKTAAAAGFTQLHGIASVLAQFSSVLPAPGTCTIVKDWSFKSQQWGASSRSRDAGTQLILAGPVGTRIMSKVSTGEYQIDLGSGFANYQLPVGQYSVSAAGGRDIGAFTASVAGGVNFSWTNKAAITNVDRSQPLTVNWGGGSLDGYVMFGGASSASAVKSAFVCVEDAKRQTLTVPSYVLSAMPTAAPDQGYLFLAKYPLQNTFTAPGIDIGYFVDFSSDSKELAFR